ncbi:hypothetical protein BH23CHL7_BH23CHL7_23590 [soil metagenome]
MARGDARCNGLAIDVVAEQAVAAAEHRSDRIADTDAKGP